MIKLSESIIEEKLKNLPGWSVKNDKLYKEFQ